jgi:hypothetical protein
MQSGSGSGSITLVAACEGVPCYIGEAEVEGEGSGVLVVTEDRPLAGGEQDKTVAIDSEDWLFTRQSEAGSTTT